MAISFTKVLNVKIMNTGSYLEVYNFLKLFLNSTPSYITVNNVHTIVESVLSEKFRDLINDSFMALPDGKPLSIIAKLKSKKKVTRIFGPTFFEKTLEWGQTDGIKHYFFGSSQETLSKMLKVIKLKYPKAIIAGSYSPPYKLFMESENKEFIEYMNKSEADIFWIGLGAPKQEIWMYENYNKLDHGVMIGIGAGFDYLAGNTKHAPEWMKKFALEWLYRLMQEPKRLWKRYLITNTLFLWYIFLEFIGIKKFE